MTPSEIRAANKEDREHWLTIASMGTTALAIGLFGFWCGRDTVRQTRYEFHGGPPGIIWKVDRSTGEVWWYAPGGKWEPAR